MFVTKNDFFIKEILTNFLFKFLEVINLVILKKNKCDKILFKEANYEKLIFLAVENK